MISRSKLVRTEKIYFGGNLADKFKNSRVFKIPDFRKQNIETAKISLEIYNQPNLKVKRSDEKLLRGYLKHLVS